MRLEAAQPEKSDSMKIAESLETMVAPAKLEDEPKNELKLHMNGWTIKATPPPNTCSADQ